MTTGREDGDIVFQVTRNGDRCSQPMPPSILIGLWGKGGVSDCLGPTDQNPVVTKLVSKGFL